MKRLPFYWITAIFYTLLIFFIAVFALPIADLFGGGSIYYQFFPAGCLLFALGLLIFLWKNRPWMTLLKWILFLLILSIYIGFYFNLEIPLEEIHVINFAILTLLYKKALKSSGQGRSSYWKAIGLAVTIGCLDEWIQKFIPGRFMDWQDMGLCVAGSTLGAGLAWIFSDNLSDRIS